MIGVIKGHGEKKTYWLDRVQVTKEEFDAEYPDKPLGGSSPSGHLPSCWPMESWSAGVHATQVREHMERDRKVGVPTEYTERGDPIFTSAEHRYRYMKSIGYHDKNGGYRG